MASNQRNSKPVLELGLLGGMFDPVHIGHLHIAQSSLEILNLDQVTLLPCGQPVHGKNPGASIDQRLAMLELAVNTCSHISVDERECLSKEPSYALTSLRDISIENPEARLYYILGQDAFNTFSTWFNWREIFDYAHIIVAARPGYSMNLAPELKAETEARKVASVEKLKQFKSGKIFFTEIEVKNISSSEVRDKLFKSENLESLLPGPVITYIDQHKLYTQEVVS